MPNQTTVYSEIDGHSCRIRRLYIPIHMNQMDDIVKRHAEASIRLALTDTRIVAIVGPRQSGKTTLARHISANDGRQFVSLDDDQFRQWAEEDPTGFLRGLKHAAIDEIQRVPKLILALKSEVDADPRPGRYLITGSVDLFKGATAPDSLAGRVETVELLPFSQAEIASSGPSQFLDRAFDRDFPSFESTHFTDRLIERVLTGGYPPAHARTAAARRYSWLQAYIKSLVRHDISEIASISGHDKLVRLVDHAALGSSRLLNMSNLARHLGVDSKTVDRWLALLEHMFVIRRVRAWHRSDLKRLVKTPKIQFLDSGLLAALLDVSAAGIEQYRQKLGTLLESFVFSEISKAIATSDDSISISHYRDKDGVEVDLVIERSSDQLVGIEIKASATARPGDFKGLRRLEEATGDQFACGIVLHDGERIQQVARKLFALPFKLLWEA